jgi:WD repeat-containing protein 90
MSIWDVSRIREGRHSIVARQVSDFPITKLRFSPYEDLKLVSCGRENIRFWRVKSAHLPGCPIVLNQYARGCDFTDIGFESAYGPASTDIRTQRRVYVSSSSGKLLQVNYSTRELECVFQLHDGPITSLSINEGFCVTGSHDKYLRVWPLDFSDFFIEAQHEDAVSSCVVSPDGIKVAIGTRNGSVGVLDVSTHSYDTLLRSHQRDVMALACRPTRIGDVAAMLEGVCVLFPQFRPGGYRV